MRRAIGIALAAAYFAAGTSLAMAQNGPPTGGYPPAAGGANSYPGLVSPYYGNYNYAAPYAGGTYYNYAAPYAAGTYYDYAGPYAAGTYSDYAAPYVVAPSYGYATPYYGTYNYAAPYYGAPGPVYSYGYFGPRWR